MEFLPTYNSADKYLCTSEAIDFTDPKIRFAAAFLMDRMMREINENQKDILPDPEMQLTLLTYEYVRDHIGHSWDICSPEVTWKASDVLSHKHGLCYAKSHLLAALLRANGIPAGMCYQYLRLDGTEKTDLVLHGLNAVYFASVGRWIRLDARGNKPGVLAEFSIDNEKLAFILQPGLGETDIPFIYSAPDRLVLSALQKYDGLRELMAHLPSKLIGEN
jgi:hypothetical protein